MSEHVREVVGEDRTSPFLIQCTVLVDGPSGRNIRFVQVEETLGVAPQSEAREWNCVTLELQRVARVPVLSLPDSFALSA